MGKSFLMRMYIKDQIQHGVQMNFALIVPTKALINEIYKQIIDEDLKSLLSEHNYKVVHRRRGILHWKVSTTSFLC